MLKEMSVYIYIYIYIYIYQERKCTYNVKLRPVLATIVAVETH